jgi:hypothetical protein
MIGSGNRERARGVDEDVRTFSRLRLATLAIAVLVLSGCSGSATPVRPLSSGSLSPAVSAHPASPRSSDSHQPTATAARPCRLRQLTVRWGRSGAALGTAYEQIIFRNTSATECTLFGYPSVVFLSQSGTVIGRPAPHENAFGRRVLPISLASGRAGHDSMGIETAADFPVKSCQPVTTAEVRITVPGDPTGRTLSSTQVICSAEQSTLVTPFLPGVPTTAGG